MDYSLLIGIHYETEANKETLATRIADAKAAPPPTYPSFSTFFTINSH
jgi:hypothetical protein